MRSVRSSRRATPRARAVALRALPLALALAVLFLAAPAALAWSPVWSDPLQGSNTALEVRAAAVVPGQGALAGDVCVAATVDSTGPLGGTPVVTCYDGTGAIVWRTPYAPAGGVLARAVDLAACATGGPLLLAKLQTSGSAYGMVLVKFTAAGGIDWQTPYRPAGVDFSPRSVTVDGAGTAYVVGDRFGAASQGVGVVKVGATGALRWKRAFLSGGTGAAIGHDRYGDAFVGATSPAHRGDWVIRKYSAAGKVGWTRTFDGVAHRADSLADLTVTSGGTVYAVGYVTRSSVASEAMLRVYACGGRWLWRATYRGSDPGFDEFTRVVRAPGGRVVAVGEFAGPTVADRDIVVVEWPAKGVSLWSDIYDGPDNLVDTPVAVSASAQGVSVLGNTETTLHGYDMVLLQYGLGGTPAAGYPLIYGGSGTSNELGAAILAAPSGGPVVTGSQDTGTGHQDTVITFKAPL
jgi:hypothetical protein